MIDDSEFYESGLIDKSLLHDFEDDYSNKISKQKSVIQKIKEAKI